MSVDQRDYCVFGAAKLAVERASLSAVKLMLKRSHKPKQG